MNVDRHSAAMDAAGFWRQFPATVAFVEPTVIVGTVEALNEIKVRDEYLPKLRIRQDDGVVVIVTAGQARLLAELVRLKPAVGDRITITYIGEAGRAAPGMNRTKEFTVEVQPAGTKSKTKTVTPRQADPVARTVARAAGDLERRLEQLDSDQIETIKLFRRTEGLTQPLMTLPAEGRLLIAGELDRRGWAAPMPLQEGDAAASPAAAPPAPEPDLFADEPF